MAIYQPKTPFEEQRSEHRAEIGRAGWKRLSERPDFDILESERAQVGIIDAFLDPVTCLDLVWRIDADNFRSEAYTESGIDDSRTSSSCNFDRYDPAIEAIDNRIADLIAQPYPRGETMQGQRYEPGQFFRPHPDFFLIDAPQWDEVQEGGGQRTWTAMIYLDQPLAGGATRFTELGFEVRAKTGRLLIWNNMDLHGAPNPYTFHEGSDVIMGRKHIVTKWFRERDWA